MNGERIEQEKRFAELVSNLSPAKQQLVLEFIEAWKETE